MACQRASAAVAARAGPFRPETVSMRRVSSRFAADFRFMLMHASSPRPRGPPSVVRRAPRRPPRSQEGTVGLRQRHWPVGVVPSVEPLGTDEANDPRGEHQVVARNEEKTERRPLPRGRPDAERQDVDRAAPPCGPSETRVLHEGERREAANGFKHRAPAKERLVAIGRLHACGAPIVERVCYAAERSPSQPVSAVTEPRRVDAKRA
eukprot:scaffold56308_cov61-Phaeocystis_antarctica.AAC.7